jgi:hypothetical protein
MKKIDKCILPIWFSSEKALEYSFNSISQLSSLVTVDLRVSDLWWSIFAKQVLQRCCHHWAARDVEQ